MKRYIIIGVLIVVLTIALMPSIYAIDLTGNRMGLSQYRYSMLCERYGTDAVNEALQVAWAAFQSGDASTNEKVREIANNYASQNIERATETLDAGDALTGQTKDYENELNHKAVLIAVYGEIIQQTREEDGNALNSYQKALIEDEAKSMNWKEVKQKIKELDQEIGKWEGISASKANELQMQYEYWNTIIFAWRMVDTTIVNGLTDKQKQDIQDEAEDMTLAEIREKIESLPEDSLERDYWENVIYPQKNPGGGNYQDTKGGDGIRVNPTNGENTDIPEITDPTQDPNSYKPGETTSTKATTMAGNILGAINAVGVVVSVVAFALIGIRYMLGSVEERANYKETMVPYLIGAVLLFATTTIVNVLYKFASGINGI